MRRLERMTPPRQETEPKDTERTKKKTTKRPRKSKKG
jgi:hypothetical protein